MEPPYPSLTKLWHNSTYDSINPLRPQLSLACKTAIITGGGSGIGPGIAQSIAKAGAKAVAILGRTEETLAVTKESIEAETGVNVIIAVADVVDEASINKAFTAICGQIGKIDILISNAGYAADILPIEDVDISDWWRGFEVNVKGSLIVCKAFLRVASENPFVINSSAAIATLPYFKDSSSYAASKLGGAKLFEYLSMENPNAFVVNLHPGIHKTAMTEKTVKKLGDVPIDDLSLAGDFCVWLLSPEAAFLRGKFVWTNWDVEEMKARSREIAGSSMLTTTLDGWPFSHELL